MRFRDQIDQELDQLPEPVLQEVLPYIAFLKHRLGLPAVASEDEYDQLLLQLLQQRSTQAQPEQRIDSETAKAYFREKYGWKESSRSCRS